MASDPHVWIIGRHGQLAHALGVAAYVRKLGVRHLARPELDLDDPDTLPDRLDTALAAHGTPRAIINAAAFTAVDLAETQPDAAFRINAQSPRLLADFCAAAGIPLFHLSTDYVFDGLADTAYREDAATNPVNVYGRSKREGETSLLASAARVMIIRTSGIFSSRGTNFVKTMLRLAEDRETLNVVSDQVTAPTPASAIADCLLDLVDQWASDATASQILHYCGDTAVSWADFARLIFDESRRLGGPVCEVTNISSQAFGAAAARPPRSVLDCSRIKDEFGIAQAGLQAALARTIHDALREKT